MDTERPHKTSSNSSSSTSELFVCFTSRLSSSSMKLSSKSLLSPSRSSSRDPPQISLSSSLSRRLRSNGSMKGGGQASPMFPSVGKRRGCGFENPEPSSPKVTCIGQVRVKTKKQGKKMRARSKRRSEASFRKTEQGLSHHHHVGGGANSSDLTRENSSSFQYQQDCLKHRNQRWVHLPLTICEALREFNCFFPCRSSCMREKGEKGVEDGSNGGHGHGHHHHHGREESCGAAFARWLHVALQEGGGDGKGREIEVVMRDEDEVEDVEDDDDGDDERSYRRHVFEDIDIDVVEGKKENNDEGVEEEEKARVSICIPPKNALLLMRCRSDPVKMAALANRFWESPVHKDQHEVDEDEEEVEEQQQEASEAEAEEEQKEVEMEEDGGLVKSTEESRNSICEREREGFVENEEEEAEVMESLELENRAMSESSSDVHEANQANEEEDEQHQEQEKDEDENKEGNANLQEVNFSCVASNIGHSDLDQPEKTQESLLPQGEEENNEVKNQNNESSELSSTPEKLNASEPQNDEESPYSEPEQAKTTTTISEALTEAEAEESSTDVEQQQQDLTIDTPPPPPPEVTPPTQEGPDPNNEPDSEERENGSKGERENREKEKQKLPECLLLMMCEPKLSMEVSKETWVCSTDFIRWLPERPAGKIPGGGGRRVSVAQGKNGVEKKVPPAPAAAPEVQPPRSSCSFPAAAGVSMAAMIEQRLATAGTKANGYEPFVLTRCKSEPMRSTAKLAADACFWKKPHAPPGTFGVGAPAGVGF